MKKWEKLCKEYSQQSGMPFEDVKEIYRLYFEFMRDIIREYDVTGDYTKEELKNAFPRFSLPGIGQFEADYIRYLRNKKEKEKHDRKIQAENDIRSTRPEEEHEEIGESDTEVLE